jgi:serine/threonine-protein kinase
MKICPTCLTCYEDADAACGQSDHGALVPSRPGSRLVDGRYRLDRLLGRGGAGAVYAGVHVALERPAAVKMLLPELAGDPRALGRFKREARAAARLNHPNVAGTYDFGTLPGGESYIVMELVEGVTLREHLGAAGALPVREAVLIARQVADGIESAHRAGIVHRDLKPSNIVVSRDQQGAPFVKVLDFGVAKLKDHATTGRLDLARAGALVGTPRYMSPEQCADREVDARSDVYSLGVILYEMLAGVAPFDAPSATALALKQIQEQPPPLEEARPGVPDALARLVMWALAKVPADRPRTAAEFSRALRAVGEQLSDATSLLSRIPTSPPEGGRGRDPDAGAEIDAPSPVTSGSKWRGRLLLALAVTVVFFASATGAVLFLRWRGQPSPATHDAGVNPAAVTSPATPEESRVAVDAPPVSEATPAPAPTPEKKDSARASETDKKALQSSLDGWVAATNSRDVKRQLSFYAPRLEVFYLSRNVPREAVLGEKKNTLGRAERVSVTVSDPTIEVGRDGLTAVMKFRKRYVLESGGKRRAGEVVQELQWSKTRPDKPEWRITAERDLRVVR